MQKLSRLFAAAGVGVLALMAGTASAAPIVISSTVDQSGYSDLQNQPVYPLTATHYDFTGQGYGSMTAINSLTVTLELNDGNTGAGEFDENKLTLGLDGIDTGIKLNGFLGGQIITLDVTGNPALAAALLSALQADGQLVGTIIDADPTNGPQGDLLGVPRLVTTTLEIDGTVRDNGGGNPVPLPAAVLVAPLGAGIAGGFARRFRKAK